MSIDKCVAETLFIDMKYVFLYHKLGFTESLPDHFVKNYREDITITIDSENQCYTYQNDVYSLNEHRNFVILELLDRLLCFGYPANSLRVNKYGITIDGSIPLNVTCEQWGSDYKKSIDNTDFTNGDVVYTSQLSGGVIDFEYLFMLDQKLYSAGLFENGISPFAFIPYNVQPFHEYPNEFLVKNNVLIEYLGHDANVVVPEGIIKLEAGAFWNRTFVQSISLPKTVKTIGGDAFAYCYSLRSVNIPENTEEIGDNPFTGCWLLKIDNRSPHFALIGDVLFTADMKRLVHYSPWKKITRYEISEQTEWVGKHCFYGCDNLHEVIIGKNVNYIGNNPFSDCSKIKLVCHSPNYVYKDGALLNKEQTTILHYSQGWDAEEYIVPDTVRTIGRNSFWNCKGIKKVVLGNNVRQIGYNPFAKCKNIEIVSKSPNFIVCEGIIYDRTVKELFCCTNAATQNEVSIPSTVQNIGRNSFSGCIGLKEIIIPESVKTIGRGAFSDCSNLENVIIPDTLESIEKWAFSYCNKLKEIKINPNTNIANEAFTGSNIEVIFK